MASKIATKFNLNKEDVQTAIKEHHAEKRSEHRADRQARLEERLSKAVSDGKLTEEQKTKILDYMKSQDAFFESLENKTDEERKTALKAHREEVKKWASDNGIDLRYVMGGGPGFAHHGDKN